MFCSCHQLPIRGRERGFAVLFPSVLMTLCHHRQWLQCVKGHTVLCIGAYAPPLFFFFKDMSKMSFSGRRNRSKWKGEKWQMHIGSNSFFFQQFRCKSLSYHALCGGKKGNFTSHSFFFTVHLLGINPTILIWTPLAVIMHRICTTTIAWIYNVWCGT